VKVAEANPVRASLEGKPRGIGRRGIAGEGSPCRRGRGDRRGDPARLTERTICYNASRLTCLALRFPQPPSSLSLPASPYAHHVSSLPGAMNCDNASRLRRPPFAHCSGLGHDLTSLSSLAACPFSRMSRPAISLTYPGPHYPA